MSFQLDPVLEKDSLLIGDIDGFSCRLINDSRYNWLVIVPTVSDITEIYQLDRAMQHKLSDLSASIGEDLMRLYKGDKLNVAAIGNRVRQLHIHHIVRHIGDAAWPGPVWGHGQAVPYGEVGLQTQLSVLRKKLSVFNP